MSFCELVGTDLKTLKQKPFLLAKHEVQNVLFKISIQALEFDSNERPTVLTTTATIQHLSTFTLVTLPTGEPLQSITQPNFQSFQSYH